MNIILKNLLVIILTIPYHGPIVSYRQSNKGGNLRTLYIIK